MNKVTLLADGGYGDAGKGQTIDKLNPNLIVRFNGGSNAAHNVVTKDFRQHTFSQVGSSALNGSHTYLSQYVRFNPINFVNECKHLKQLGETGIFDTIWVNGDCLVITLYHRMTSENNANVHKRGTCGTGTGEAWRYFQKYGEEALRLKDLIDGHTAHRKLEIQARRFSEQFPDMNFGLDEMEVVFRELMDTVRYLKICTNDFWPILRDEYNHVGFEMSQGVLLDHQLGDKPFVTSSDCTFKQAYELLDGYDRETEKLMVIRSYSTRHGEGKLFTEDEALDTLPERHNIWNPYQGKFRRGWLNLDEVRKSINILGGIDGLVITHMDYIRDDRMPFKVYDNGEYKTIFNVFELEKMLNVKIKILGYGARSVDYQVVE